MKAAHIHLGLIFLTAGLPGLRGMELQPTTVKAWDDYIGKADSRMQMRLNGQQPFLWSDEVSGRSSLLQRGKTAVAPLAGDGAADDRVGADGARHHGHVFGRGAEMAELGGGALVALAGDELVQFAELALERLGELGELGALRDGERRVIVDQIDAFDVLELFDMRHCAANQQKPCFSVK